MQTLHLINLHLGFGDVLACLWAVQTAKDAGHPVVFYTPKHEFARIWHEDSRPVAEAPEAGDPRGGGLIIFGRQNENRLLSEHGGSRIELILGRIETALGLWPGGLFPRPHRPQIRLEVLPSLTLPQLDIPWATGLDWSRVVLLFPFSEHAQRAWPLAHWQLLAIRLEEERGLIPLALGSAAEAPKLAGFARSLWGLPWLQVAALMQAARLTITNDSGPFHLASALGLPVLALSAIMPASTFAEYATGPHPAQIITPPAPTCAGCHFQPRLGYRPPCHTACRELSSLTPATVLTAIK